MRITYSIHLVVWFVPMSTVQAMLSSLEETGTVPSNYIQKCLVFYLWTDVGVGTDVGIE